MSRCNVYALPDDCMLDARVPTLLAEICDRCPPAADPSVDDAGKLSECTETSCPKFAHNSPGVCLDSTQVGGAAFADLALELSSIALTSSSLYRQCAVAYWAALLVTLQLSVNNSQLDIPLGINTTADAEPFSSHDGFDLFPFPLWSKTRSLGDQIDFHSRFLSAHQLICDDVHKTGPSRSKYVLRAGHDKPEYHCAVRYSDRQLIRRCRERRRYQQHSGMRGYAIGTLSTKSVIPVPMPRFRTRITSIDEIECPSWEEQASFFARRSDAKWSQRSNPAILKYTERAGGRLGQPGRGCEEPASEWRVDLRIYHKCVLVVILDRLQLAPESMVLDWGAGCGHKLTWAAQLYDVNGLGIDIVADNVAWAQQNSIGKFCHLDGRFVSWLPDSFFDAVISYAALNHLEPDDQCEVVLELVSKVRVGGRLWFGWNSPNIVPVDALLSRPEVDKVAFWKDCFSSAMQQRSRWVSGEVAAAWETESEQFLFSDDFSNHDTYLFWPPAYSLFVTRVSSQHPHQYF